jgi:16S rRNA A1518/A1519 N6-dimethyltransferase RsmA/KsgA/DIM1 with predicted DNA glycosylase/AP lyase activity
VSFRRRVGAPEEFDRVKRIVEGAFAHRRKTLVNSLELAGVTSKAQAVAALADLGHDPAVRAEALRPDAFVPLAEILG